MSIFFHRPKLAEVSGRHASRTSWRKARARLTIASRRFSRPLLEQLEQRCLLAAITVTGTGDTIAEDGVVTLREAIASANNNSNVNADVIADGDYGTDGIAFNIPGTGVHTIHVGESGLGPLPIITGPITIDGYTQPGASANTNSVESLLGSNAVLVVELAEVRQLLAN